MGRLGRACGTLAVVTLATATSACGGGSGSSATSATAPRPTATAPPSTSPPTTAPPAPTTVPVTAPPAFSGTVAPVTAAELGASWHDGCPVGPDELRRVRLSYWGFDNQPHVGTLVVHADVAPAVMTLFQKLYDQRFPIRRMDTIDAFGGSDPASMDADNTSGFNCRLAVAAGPPQWSVHAYGKAIDVNPVENPYLEGGRTQPAAGDAWLDRANVRPGMAGPGSPLNDAFTAAGWQWGGRWADTPDYQHFSATGG